MNKILKNKIENYLIYIITAIVSLGLAFLIAKLSYQVLFLMIFLAVIIIIFTKNKYIPYIILFSIIGGQLARYSLADRGGVVISDVLVPIILFAWLTFKSLKDQKFTSSKLNLIIMLFLMAISFSWAINYSYFSLDSLFYFLRLAGYILLYFVFLDFIDIRKFNSYINLLMIVGIIISVLGFIQLIYFPDFSLFSEFQWDPHLGRLLSTFFDPNYLGGFLAIITAIGICMFFSSKTIEGKTWYMVSIAIMLSAITFTYSRSGILALAVMILIIGILRSWKLLAISILACIIIISYNPRLLSRIEGAISIDETAKLRILNWEESYELVKIKPLFGIGYNNLVELKIDEGLIEENDIVSHSVAGSDNSFLTLAITTGAIGLFLFLAMLFMIIWDSWKMLRNIKIPSNFRNYALAVLAVTVGLVIHSQFVNSFLYPHILLLYIFIIALFYKVYNQEKDSI